MDIFNFKQFAVNQNNCAMKVNTDGVLLGALVNANEPKHILDIGTGTGVIALMLAQRFPDATIDAVEVDDVAAGTANENFKASKFANRLKVYPLGFNQYFETCPEKRYDLIVANPPFYVNALASPGAKRNLAKHADQDFFERLIKGVAYHLKPDGQFVMILPLETSRLVKMLLPRWHLYLQKTVNIKSFAHSAPHREIIRVGKEYERTGDDELIIYGSPKVYSKSYQFLLKDFLTIF